MKFSASALALPEKSNNPRWCVCVYRASLFPRRCHDTLSTKLGGLSQNTDTLHNHRGRFLKSRNRVSNTFTKTNGFGKRPSLSAGKSAPTKTDWIFKNHRLLWGGEGEKVLYRIDFHQNVGGNTFSSLLDSFRFDFRKKLFI